MRTSRARPPAVEPVGLLVAELQALDAAHALGDVKDKQYQGHKEELLRQIGRAKVRARLAPGEEVLAEHHFQQSHFPFTGFAFGDVAQESVSFFATDRRLCRWRFVDRPDRRQSSLSGEDRLEALDYENMRGVVLRREWRWGEAAVALATLVLALLLWPWLQFSAPILAFVGAAGLAHALFVPTPYWLIANREGSQEWRVYAAGKPSAKALIEVVQVGVARP